ncbi:hypothetical protein [Okeania sp. KiyG1]|uniref:hypothetical protein n=1 Tax=Okeania sp. KiyG1 TaxID=2720165 RepID=UPI0019237444|nr:hypothetical protein [Okeania sp. KiyG1]GGA08286.1 hypothetical protein CYANOKiyG1_20910 [Okeania sp. KiyG1]
MATKMFLTQQLEYLVKQTTKLENEEVTLPILISSMLIPSTLTTNYLITVVYGNDSDATNNITLLASKLYNVTWHSSILSSYAGIRNYIAEKRDILIPVPDVQTKALGKKKKEELFEMLKVGVNSTGKVFTPKKKYEFDVGCPKILSTKEYIWKDAKFNNIKDRFVIIPAVEFIKFINEDEDYDYEVLFKAREKFWLSAASEFEENLKFVEGVDRQLIATMATIYDISVSEAVEKVSIYQEFVKKYF